MPDITTWTGTYRDGWQEGDIVPAAFSHPAKVSKGLAFRLIRHLITQGYVQAGALCIDPFAGIGGFALPAMSYGLRFLGVELEERFVALAQQNLALWQLRYGFVGGDVVQSDSRVLRQVLAGVQAGCVVGSPPFSPLDCQPTGRGQGVRSSYYDGTRKETSPETTYGTTPGQLGALPPGTPPACVVGSPPYIDTLSSPNHGIKDARRTKDAADIQPAHYGSSPGQLGAMPAGAVVGSPPWENSLAGDAGAQAPHDTTGRLTDRYKDRPVGAAYQDVSQRKRLPDGTWPRQRNEGFYDNLGINQGDTFWSAADAVMREVAALLPPGAVACWVVKGYVSKGRLVDFPAQWLALCERHGFMLVEEIHTSLVEDHGTQEGLFGDAEVVQTERKSFFRRLHEKRPGAVRIDHETIFILEKL